MDQLQHLHDHPLLFNEEYSEDWAESQVFCWACEDAVISGPLYNCSECYFYLHKSCAELPTKWEHSFHSEHPLILFTKSPYGGGYSCNACRQVRKSFVYHCSDCQFDLDIRCALLGPKASSIKRKGDTEFLHFSHGHPLIFKNDPPQNIEEEEEDVVCSGCKRVISDPFYYDCNQCVFKLHKSCAELPRLAHLPIHPQHPLLLFKNDFQTCTRCFQPRHVLFYECKTCQFYVDIGCALLQPDTCCITRRGNGDQIEHFSHNCSLTLDEEVQKYAGEEHNCNVCGELVSAPYYNCSKCKLSIHKSCAELPSVIKCNLHITDHSLFLFPSENYSCNNCGSFKLQKFCYCCFQCNFYLDIKCSLSSPNAEENHQHDFIRFQKKMDFTCQVCGKEDKVCPWLCAICHLFAHRECAQSPKMLKIRQHHHKLNLIYSLSKVHDQPDNIICKLCYKKVNSEYAAYYCVKCNYAAHLDCGIKRRIVFVEGAFDEENYGPDTSIELLSNKFDKFMNDFVFETKLEEHERGQRLEHFSHEHSLTLADGKLTIRKHCDGCARPISAPHYSCGECNFYLHRTCGEIPIQIQHPLHSHSLALMSTHLTKERFSFKCSACGGQFHGFGYMCRDCNYVLDIRCASVGEKLKHPLHQHFLFTPSTRNDEKCSACGTESKFILVCPECDNFALDYRCATLPQVVRHRYDKHLLKLTNITRNDSDEYYCEICEEERDPNNWYYYCKECDFSAHPHCLLGDYPYLKRGITWQYQFHSHPLTLVEESTRNYANCEGCSKKCYSLSVECAPCKFQVHYDCTWWMNWRW